MDVYLVPAGEARHELYCEVAAPVPTDDTRSSLWRRATESFRRAVAEGEAERARDPSDPPRADQGRLRRAITHRLAEVVTEQRLLWHLRKETTARLFHPDSLDAERALTLARTALAADYARHRRWFIVDGLLTALTGPLFFFVPGPNIVSWYFTFRAVGHFLSMRGARQGQSVVEWACVPSAHLTTVAQVLAWDAVAVGGQGRRAQTLAEAGAALGLEGLATFVERISTRSA